MEKIDEEFKIKIYQRMYYLKQKKIKKLNNSFNVTKGTFLISFS